MTKVVFVPLGFTPSDREALMTFDRSVCEALKPGQEFARPLVSWEFPQLYEQNQTTLSAPPKPNVTVVRKLSDEVRMRGYAYIPGLNLNRVAEIEIRADYTQGCLLCGAPTVYGALCIPNKSGTRYESEGSSFDTNTYGLCQKCFDLPDKVERIEKKLGII